jgi:hypothetical protein
VSANNVPKNNHLKDIENPVFTCPNCQTEKFDTQRKMIEHALPCKRGELKND